MAVRIRSRATRRSGGQRLAGRVHDGMVCGKTFSKPGSWLESKQNFQSWNGAMLRNTLGRREHRDYNQAENSKVCLAHTDWLTADRSRPGPQSVRQSK